MIIKDISGMKFGSLVVIEKDMATRKNYWICKCDCGNLKSIFRGHLTANRIDNCGCLTIKRRAANKRTHGETNTRLFKIWNGMINRCRKIDKENYKHYGNRGIVVCDEWKNNYIEFKKWALNNGYSDNLSIDRVDNNGNYEPSNCRWATNKEQANNKSTSHFITYKNETHTKSEWCEILKIPTWTITNRIKYGWSLEKALFTPVKKQCSRKIKVTA